MAEVLGLAAGIAGLLGLTGQCLAGALKLQELYSSIKKSTQRIRAFLKELNGLIRALIAVQNLLERLQSCGGAGLSTDTCDNVRLCLEDCHNDIRSWIQAAQQCLPQADDSKDKGLRGRLRMMSIAVSSKDLVGARRDILARRAELSLALSTLGRELDMHIAQAAKSVEARVHETHAQTVLSNAALERIEAASASLSEEVNSVKSLISACNSAPGNLQPHENPHDVADLLPRTRVWRCDGWTLMSQLYQSTGSCTCAFCGLEFEALDQDGGINARAHIIREHNPTGCALDPTPFMDMTDFHDHLVQAHEGKVGAWTVAIDKACMVDNNYLQSPSLSYMGLFHEMTLPGTERDLGDTQPNQPSDSDHQGLASPAATYEAPATDNPETDLQALLTTSWQSTLLRDWTTATDRINKWMLHMLGEEPEQLRLHRQMFVREHGQLTVQGRDWARMITMYWPLDEAAADRERPICTAVGSEHGRIESSLYMSMHRTGQTKQSLRSRLKAASIRSFERVESRPASRQPVSSPTQYNNPHSFLAVPQQRDRGFQSYDSSDSGASGASTADTMGSINEILSTYVEPKPSRPDPKPLSPDFYLNDVLPPSGGLFSPAAVQEKQSILSRVFGIKGRKAGIENGVGQLQRRHTFAGMATRLRG